MYYMDVSKYDVQFRLTMREKHMEDSRPTRRLARVEISDGWIMALLPNIQAQLGTNLKGVWEETGGRRRVIWHGRVDLIRWVE